MDANTQYYLRAYATNDSGTGYGGEIDFFTGKTIRKDVFLTSQEEVNNFGNENYLTVIGNLNIGSTQGSDIVDLKPLSTLNQVRGELVIGGSARVGDGFTRLSNPLLENLDGLESLVFIGPFFLNDFSDKVLRIEENESLRNIKGMSNLRLFEGSIFIGQNPKLESLEGLEKLTKIGSLFITGNDALRDLNDLENLKTLKGSIILTGNEILKDVDILGNISGRVATFVLNGNQLITNVDFMSSQTEVLGNLILKDSPQLINIEGLNGVRSVGGSLQIENTALTSVDGLNDIESVGQFVRIRENIGLETLNGLNGLESVTEYVHITSNENLTSISGFNQLKRSAGLTKTSLGGITLTDAALQISFNNKLQDINGFKNMTEAFGDFFFGGDSLKDITGFNNLKTIRGQLAFSFANQITDITGFGSIRTIGDLRIQQNGQIQNLNFLATVETVEKDISIFLNNNLSNFCGLKTLVKSNFSGDFDISNNAFNPTREQIANGDCSN